MRPLAVVTLAVALVGCGLGVARVDYAGDTCRAQARGLILGRSKLVAYCMPPPSDVGPEKPLASAEISGGPLSAGGWDVLGAIATGVGAWFAAGLPGA